MAAPNLPRPVDRRERLQLLLRDNPTKRDIMRAVSKKAKSLTELANELDLAPPTIHHHVQHLLQEGLVDRERVGRRVYVSATPAGLDLLRSPE